MMLIPTCVGGPSKGNVDAGTSARDSEELWQICVVQPAVQAVRRFLSGEDGVAANDDAVRRDLKNERPDLWVQRTCEVTDTKILW